MNVEINQAIFSSSPVFPYTLLFLLEASFGPSTLLGLYLYVLMYITNATDAIEPVIIPIRKAVRPLIP
jgi:hypothetical protein